MTSEIGFDPVAYINEPHWQESRLGLDRIVELLDRLGRPQDKLRFVHVAGTNGKGSVCAFLASILQEAGFHTGLFTSPYVHEFADRIRIDGANISDRALCEVTLAVKAAADAMDDHPTEFELMTAVALTHFARQDCDIAVIEVGLGGRLDSTNVIETPEACIIAPIGLDHTEVLGDTIAKIAAEKAGIIKQGVPVISWVQKPEAQVVVEQAAREKSADLFFPDLSALFIHDVVALHNTDGSEVLVRPFDYRGRHYTVGLLGAYQPNNAALALDAVDVLRHHGWEIPEPAIVEGLAKTKWPGRFEIVAAHPPFIVDGGHNPDGARVLAASLADVFPERKVVFIMGVLKDKDYPAMIAEVLPMAAAFITITPENPRALTASELAQTINDVAASQHASIAVHVATSFGDAVQKARACVVGDMIICAFGSLFSIASIEDALSLSD